MGEYDHLWNDLPDSERHRLIPYAIESQILHLEQAKALAKRAHRRHMAEIDDWIESLKKGLPNQ